jgi:hypothetical protein
MKFERTYAFFKKKYFVQQAYLPFFDLEVMFRAQNEGVAQLDRALDF